MFPIYKDSLLSRATTAQGMGFTVTTGIHLLYEALYSVDHM